MTKTRRYTIHLLVIALTLMALPTSYGRGDSPRTEPAGRQLPAPQEEDEDGSSSEKADKKDKDDPCADESPGRSEGKKKKCPPAGSSNGFARGDFNGDLIADLAVGVPGEDTPGDVTNSGAVIVIYGSENGLSTSAPLPSQFWSQDSTGVPGASEAQDRFGAALAAGDFNGDNRSDLAIGIPGEDITRDGTSYENSGAVVVIYGSQDGLSATNPGLSARFFDFGNDAERIVGRERLGSALAWGDFNEDDIGDLAIGAPGAEGILVREFFSDGVSAAITRETVNAAGAVWVLPGTPTGLSLRPEDHQFLHGDATDDNFGAALAAGNFFTGLPQGDRFVSELAVGIPNADYDLEGSPSYKKDAGMVRLFQGRPDFFELDPQGWYVNFGEITFRTFPSEVFGQVAAASGDHYGSVLAVGDFDGNGNDELAIGVPDREVAGITDAGAVVIWEVTRRQSIGLVELPLQLWHQNNIFGPNRLNSSEAGDRFGSSLAAGDFNFDGYKDLAIGVPYESIISLRTGTATNVIEAGEVDVIYGSSAGLSITVRTPQSWDQDDVNIEEVAEQGDRFGWSLTAWNFGKGDQADLAIGVPFEDLPVSGTSQQAVNAGGVNVIYGSPPGSTQSASNGLTTLGDQFWSQASPGVPGGVESGDYFGQTLY